MYPCQALKAKKSLLTSMQRPVAPGCFYVACLVSDIGFDSIVGSMGQSHGWPGLILAARVMTR